MADGGMRKCSAVEDFARRGACPPLGSGWGVAESAVPIRCTKPQLRLFTPWCAGSQPACAITMEACPGVRSRIDAPINFKGNSFQPRFAEPSIAAA